MHIRGKKALYFILRVDHVDIAIEKILSSGATLLEHSVFH